MNNNTNRKQFLRQLGALSLGAAFSSFSNSHFDPAKKPFFEISLAEWSLHRTLQAGKLDNLDFPAKAKNDFGIYAVEYVDQFFRDKAEDMGYLKELKRRTSDLGVRNVLIMIDTAGPLASIDSKERQTAVENHHKWVNAAKFLGCHSIRVNLRGTGTREEMSGNAIDGLGKLTEYGAKAGIGIIVENHGGFSSDGKWLVNVIKQVNNPYCGTLPDFGNFCVERTENKCTKEYDRYLGVQEMAPFAKGFSGKTLDFDKNGQETTIDYNRMMKIVKKGLNKKVFKGYIDLEYSGNRLSEDEGIIASKRLLEKYQQG